MSIFRKPTISRRDLEHAESAVARTLSRKGTKLEVVFEGTEAKTDGNTIILPTGPDGDIKREDAEVIAGYADHESAHILYSDLEIPQKLAQEVKAGKTNRFVPVMTNSLEDIRIEREITRDYPGSAHNINATVAAAVKASIETIGETFPDGIDAKKNAKDVLPLATAWAGRKLAGMACDEVDDFMSHIPDALRERAEKLAKAVDAFRDGPDGSQDALTLARRVNEELEKEDEDDDDQNGGDEQGDGQGDGQGGQGQSQGQQDGTGGDGEEEQASGGVGACDGATSENDPLSPSLAPALPKSDIKAMRSKYIPYTRSCDVVVKRNGEYEGPAQPTRSVTNCTGEAAQKKGRDIFLKEEKALGSSVATMRRKLFGALMDKRKRGWSGGKRLGRLDPKRLVGAYTGAEHVYRNKDNVEDVNTAVMVLVDGSGSMSGTKIKLAGQVSIALALALEGTGVAYEILEFGAIRMTSLSLDGEDVYAKTAQRYQDDLNARHREAHKPGGSGHYALYSRGTSSLVTVQIKGFDESLHEAKGVLGYMSQYTLSHNLDGASLEYCYTRLQARPEGKKVILVLSDGEPCDDREGSGPMGEEQHLKNTINRITKDGVHIVGLGICSSAVKEYYPKHEVINDLDDLPKSVMSHISKMILGERFVVDNADLNNK